MEEKKKLFCDWNSVKTNLDLNGRQPNPAQGEIWWAGVGLNIGTEMNGKSRTFARPVLVYKKLSRYNFMAIPLTSQKHDGSWYVSFRQNGVDEVASSPFLRKGSVEKSSNMVKLYQTYGKMSRRKR